VVFFSAVFRSSAYALVKLMIFYSSRIAETCIEPQWKWKSG